MKLAIAVAEILSMALNALVLVLFFLLALYLIGAMACVIAVGFFHTFMVLT